jgi:carboxypeptidase C (cathepsin A)
MLYIDQPVLTGLSYSIPEPACANMDGDIAPLTNGTCPTGFALGSFAKQDASLTAHSTLEAAENFWKALQGFVGAFPQYAKKEFIFATESYGGHWAPVFSKYIFEKNQARSTDTAEISISAVLINNGLHNAMLQYPPTYDFVVNNPYNLRMLNKSMEANIFSRLFGKGGCMDRLNVCNAPNGTNEICQAADDFCYDTQELATSVSKRDRYDIRYLKPNPFPPASYARRYLNSEKVQQAIGAYVNFTYSSNFIFNGFLATGDTVRNLSIIEDMQNLVARKVPLLLFYGDADYLCHWKGGEAVANRLNIPGFDSTGYENITTSDGRIHGQVRQVDDFAFVRIYDSGHMVPFYKPLLALELLERVIERLDIATGTKKYRKKTYGPLRSEYKEGNETVQWTVVPERALYNPGSINQSTKS